MTQLQIRKILFSFGALVFLGFLIVVAMRFVKSTDRMPAGYIEQPAVNFLTPAKVQVSREDIERRTGLSAKQARAVDVAVASLIRPTGTELKIQIHLFEKASPVFVLKVTSGLDVNEGLHTGFALDDQNSRIELATADGLVSGFIKYRDNEYRILGDSGRHVHYLIEIRK